MSAKSHGWAGGFFLACGPYYISFQPFCYFNFSDRRATSSEEEDVSEAESADVYLEEGASEGETEAYEEETEAGDVDVSWKPK